jgi:hypothetical protein
LIQNGRKSNQLKENLIKTITNDISSQTQIINNNKNNFGFPLFTNGKTANNILNNNTNNNHKNINKRNKINTNCNFYSYVNHNSLYSIMKNNKLFDNSPLKCIDNIKNNNIIKKFIKFSSNISKTKNRNINEENLIINDKNTTENKKISERTAKNNDILLKIKDSLDDNLKHILNFSYENFLNKESERDCN